MTSIMVLINEILTQTVVVSRGRIAEGIWAHTRMAVPSFYREHNIIDIWWHGESCISDAAPLIKAGSTGGLELCLRGR